MINTMETVDIAIVGSGIASTVTLIEVFRKLIDGVPDQKKLSISVIEKHHEFWLGIPYGSRSSVNALTITSIADFLTNEKERELFFDWFKIHQHELIEWYLLNGGLTAEYWLKNNKAALDKHDWKNIYLPRFMFGRYLHINITSLLKTIEERNLAHLTLINGEVIDVTPDGDGLYEVTIEMSDQSVTKLSAPKVVIATGSAPVKDFNASFQNNDQIAYINNLYEPSAKVNTQKLEEVLTSVTDFENANVLIIGTNASSIELLYLLAGLPNLTNAMNKLVLVSKSGLLPYHISTKTLPHYLCEHLDQVNSKGSYSIEDLISAAMQDIKPAVKDGVIVPYIDRIIGYTIELMQPLDEEAKKKFLGIYGMQLSNLFRRSGTDYKQGEAILLEMQKLTSLKGSFADIEPTDKGGLLKYIDPETNELKTYDVPFKAVINCTGSNDLDKSSSKLIYNLVHNNIAKVNLSGKGFYVNEKFEAAPNLYVMGPLLGGNKNDRIHFWHLENASRLIYLAPFLADCLLED